MITGGAGFIGSHLADFLLHKGHEIIVFDSLDPQVHHGRNLPPDYLSKQVKFIHGDVRNSEQLAESLQDIDVVYHLAAAVGVAQSMYQVQKFIDVNSHGTANLLDVLINKPNHVKKLIVASSMSIYGEGSYNCPTCKKIVNPKVRQFVTEKTKDWEYSCPICQNKLIPFPTRENKPADCSTVYALSKKEQEDLCMMIGKTYGLNTTVLRFFGTYGSRQALSNPYTGVCAIFSTALLSNNRPIVYEDGNQSRDLIHVKDIVQALNLSMERSESKHEIFNVGTGKSVSISEVATILSNALGKKIHPEISYKFRSGDVRHICADISKISEKLGFKPQYSFSEGISELIPWIKEKFILNGGNIVDNSVKAKLELEKKGLI
ncbi:ADP-L-glycero-D-manno-heptose-6-epimerase [Candidatus Lokiarchaeum ossiferum]|uniref:ADP-L-glycero-D-manno-heptose-6-epimerase n=1 Tax=Candidatus Lokiarchaeum ossiferum TaxID=2951803 RepID=A0ABY6HWI4_9ARCH|nr:ADP-L-glycero-D-manno-heptose-6-epimerase [Candidatus Lokiarchaeum sp. B-35]